MFLECGAFMIVLLIIYAALVAIMPIVSLFPSNIFDFSERCHWIEFLLFLISKIERFGCEVIFRFSGNNSDCFCTLKILVDALVLSSDKNVSIREAKYA